MMNVKQKMKVKKIANDKTMIMKIQSNINLRKGLGLGQR